MEAVDFVRLGFSSGAKVSLSFDEFCGRDRIDAIYSMLRSKDPQLGKNFLVFATFLKHIAPDLLEGFLDMVENVLRAEGESRRGNISVLKSSFSFKLDFKMVVTEKDISKDEVFTNLSLKLSFDFRTTVQVKNIDPILLDMNGNGIKLTGLNDPVLFDIDGDGVEERVSFVEGDDAFLFLDLNMNKFLDGGWELVGDNGGWSNGFELLRAFDFNRDGKINPEDPVYNLLYIFQDLNRNRKLEWNEHRSLFEANITEIDLHYKRFAIKLNETDKLIAISSYKAASNVSFKVWDVILSYIE